MTGSSLRDSAWKASQECALAVKAAACRPGRDRLRVQLARPATATSMVEAGPQDIRGDAKRAGLVQF